MKHIPYGRQNISQEDIDAVVEVLKSDLLAVIINYDKIIKIKFFEE